MDRGGFDRDARDHDLLAAAREAAVDAEREYELARTESLVSSAQETLKERPRDVPLHEIRNKSGMYDERCETERWDNTARLLELREAHAVFENCFGVYPDLWRHATLKERVEALQSVEAILADHQRRDAMYVRATWLSPALGSAHPVDKVINVSARLIKTDLYFSLESLFHESRHVYQYDVITRESHHREVPSQQREYWLEGASTYPRPLIWTRAAFLKYHFNPLELDARKYASRQTERFFLMLRHFDETASRRNH